MAGACPPALSIAVAGAGGLGACGALLLQPNDIRTWAAQFRAATSAPFQINLWIPDTPPVRDGVHEANLRAFRNGGDRRFPTAPVMRCRPILPRSARRFSKSPRR
jgi:nitronate monooxygenase